MALQAASTVEVEGGDWLDFKELAKNNTAAVFSVLEIEEDQNLGNGALRPVRARVVILSGDMAGEVHENERILAAGIRSRLTEVGNDVVGRLRPYGQRKHPGLEAEQEGDVELAQAWLDHLDNGGPKPGTKASAGKSGPSKVAKKSAPEPVEEDDEDNIPF